MEKQKKEVKPQKTGFLSKFTKVPIEKIDYREFLKMLQNPTFLWFNPPFFLFFQLSPNPNLDFKQIQIWINKIIVLLLLSHLYFYPLRTFLSNQQYNS